MRMRKGGRDLEDEGRNGAAPRARSRSYICKYESRPGNAYAKPKPRAGLDHYHSPLIFNLVIRSVALGEFQFLLILHPPSSKAAKQTIELALQYLQ